MAKDRADNPSRKVDPRVFINGKHIGFQDENENFMNFDQDTAAQKHFAAQGYNKGTAGDMLKNSKSRVAESTEAGSIGVQNARKSSQERVASREEVRRQERGE